MYVPLNVKASWSVKNSACKTCIVNVRCEIFKSSLWPIKCKNYACWNYSRISWEQNYKGHIIFITFYLNYQCIQFLSKWNITQSVLLALINVYFRKQFLKGIIRNIAEET